VIRSARKTATEASLCVDNEDHQLRWVHLSACFFCNSGSMYQSERAFVLRDFRRIAVKIYPTLVITTPTVTMTDITAIKATTVGIAAAIAEGFSLRIDIHFKFAGAS
jgi:hypothetical protein